MRLVESFIIRGALRVGQIAEFTGTKDGGVEAEMELCECTVILLFLLRLFALDGICFGLGLSRDLGLGYRLC